MSALNIVQQLTVVIWICTTLVAAWGVGDLLLHRWRMWRWHRLSAQLRWRHERMLNPKWPRE